MGSSRSISSKTSSARRSRPTISRPTKPIGTGPFKFKEWVRGDHVTVVANPDYHLGAPALDQYVYKVVKDNTVLYQQLKTGEVDYGTVSPDFYDDAKKQTNFDTVPYDTFSFTYIAFNLDPAKTTLFQDVETAAGALLCAGPPIHRRQNPQRPRDDRRRDGTGPLVGVRAGQDHDEVQLRSEEGGPDARRSRLEAGVGRHPRQGRQATLLHAECVDAATK